MFSTLSIVAPATPETRDSPALVSRGRACDACRRLKIKCHVPRPPSADSQKSNRSCTPCLRARSKCTYNDKPAKRGRPWGRRPNPAPLQIHTGLNTPASPGETSPERPKKVHDSIVSLQTDSSDGCAQSTSSGDQDVTPPAQPLDTSPDNIPQDEEIGPVPPLPCDERIWTAVHEFFDTTYIIFPVVSYDAICSKLILEPDWAADGDFRTLLYGLQTLTAAAQYRIDSQDGPELRRLVRQVEESRLTYDFADPPTLNGVVVSLCLFTAYNVLERHNRAFLYLDEALTLFEGAEMPTTVEEEKRRFRLAQVLFNTESAALGIYANETRRQLRKAHRPALLDTQPPAQDDIFGTSRVEFVAMRLLDRLTRIHMAEDVDQMSIVSVQTAADPPDMALSLGETCVSRLRFSRLQSADVAITLQWRLSRMLAAQHRHLDKQRMGHLGVAAISWICCLSPGDLRVVGLGKVAGLAMNIAALAPGEWQQDVLRGLMSAVIREDHEGVFSPLLVDLIVPAVPAPMGLVGRAGPGWVNMNGNGNANVNEGRVEDIPATPVPIQVGVEMDAGFVTEVPDEVENAPQWEIPIQGNVPLMESLDVGNQEWLFDSPP